MEDELLDFIYCISRMSKIELLKDSRVRVNRAVTEKVRRFYRDWMEVHCFSAHSTDHKNLFDWSLNSCSSNVTQS